MAEEVNSPYRTLTISDGTQSWEVAAIDERHPEAPALIAMEMMLWGRCYIYRGPDNFAQGKPMEGLSSILESMRDEDDER